MRKYILIVLAVLVAASIVLCIAAKGKIISLNNELKKQETTIQKYQKDKGITVDNTAVTKLREENAAIEKEFNKALAVFDTGKNELPGDITDKGIYFFQSLQNSMKLLEREATAKKMVLPSVDFSVDVPREEDVPYLLKQTEMIEDIVGIIIAAGKCEITTIKPLAVDKTKKILDFDKLGLQIVLSVDSDALANVLSEISRRAPLYFIEEFSLMTIEPPRVKVSFVASRIITGVSLEDVTEFKGKDKFDLNTAYPSDVNLKSFSKRNPFFRTKDLVSAAEASSQGADSGDAKASKKDVKPPTPQFTYKGSIYTEGQLTGIIEDNWLGKTCFSKVGDLCSGYKVTKIEDKKLTLSKDNQEIVLIKGANNEKDEKKQN